MNLSLKNIVLAKLKNALICLLEKTLIFSLKEAAREQKINTFVDKIVRIVPDISEQFSSKKIIAAYQQIKVRNLHAFQVSLIDDIFHEFKEPVVVDIGDSAGTHLQYINGLYPLKKIKCLSVNIDRQAVDKIKGKGLEAVHAKAEDLDKYNINADIFLCFEVCEHLMDPCGFLYKLSTQTKVKYLIVTVPYVASSRVGLKHIRRGTTEPVGAETTHIFEFSPKDWKLLAQHCGWNVFKERIYLQYPRRSILCMTRYFWKSHDFEGFLGMVLTRDNTWASRYLDW